jgi:serine/threonine protein phosphatase 1
MKHLLSRFLNRKVPEPRAQTDAGKRVYAVGDIHGRLDLLEQMLSLIEQDQSAHPTDMPAHLVLLGDYVDRGLQSSDVIDRILLLREELPHLTCLRGNHEDILLQIAEGSADDDMLTSWLSYGGRETLASYGVSSRILYGDDIATIADLARQVVPATHKNFLRTLPLSHSDGDYLFVHAGVHPARDIDAQRDHDLMWIREPFLSWKEDFGKTVVHGHSISTNVEVRPNRIGIDTGAYATGKLTAVVLEHNSRRFLETRV